MHTQQYCQYTIVRQIVGVIKRKYKNTGNCAIIIIVIFYWYTNFVQQFNPLEMLPNYLKQLSRGVHSSQGCRNSTRVAVPVDGISRGSRAVVKVRSKREAVGSLQPNMSLHQNCPPGCLLSYSHTFSTILYFSSVARDWLPRFYVEK